MTNLLCPHCDTSVDEHEAGRCLDAWVAEAVMGWRWEPAKDGWLVFTPDGEEVAWLETYGGYGPKYSTDIVAAWEVVGCSSLSLVKTKEGWLAGQYDLEEEYLDVEFGVIDGRFSRGYATADIAPLAICRAALKAMGETGEGKT